MTKNLMIFFCIFGRKKKLLNTCNLQNFIIYIFNNYLYMFQILDSKIILSLPSRSSKFCETNSKYVCKTS